MLFNNCDTIGDLLTIRQAALVLGVHPQTMRRWDKARVLVAMRHPINQYRLYRKDALERFLAELRKA